MIGKVGEHPEGGGTKGCLHQLNPNQLGVENEPLSGFGIKLLILSNLI